MLLNNKTRNILHIYVCFVKNFFLENIFSFSGKYTILKSHKRGYTLNRNCAKKQIHWVGLFSFNNFCNKYFWFLWIEFRSSCCLSFKRKLVACNEFSFLQNNIYCLTKNLRSHGFLHDMLLQNTQNGNKNILLILRNLISIHQNLYLDKLVTK